MRHDLLLQSLEAGQGQLVFEVDQFFLVFQQLVRQMPDVLLNLRVGLLLKDIVGKILQGARRFLDLFQAEDGDLAVIRRIQLVFAPQLAGRLLVLRKRMVSFANDLPGGDRADQFAVQRQRDLDVD